MRSGGDIPSDKASDADIGMIRAAVAVLLMISLAKTVTAAMVTIMVI